MSTKVKGITSTKFLFATLFLAASAFAAAGTAKLAGCAPQLMNVTFEKNTLTQAGLDQTFESKEHNYATKYRKGWEASTYDFDNFTAPVGSSGVSIAVPAAFLNGGAGMAPLPPVLKKTKVLISGYHAEWSQRWLSDQCIESGEIKFLNAPANWVGITYQGTKTDLQIIKAMIYSIRFLKS